MNIADIILIILLVANLFLMLSLIICFNKDEK